MNERYRQNAMSDDPDPWQTRASNVAFRNRWITVEIDDVVLPTGAAYEYTRLNVNAVGVALVGFSAAGNEILLEREYRHGVGQVIWQLPGGLAEADEDLARAGLRELLEETGYAPKHPGPSTVRYLGTVWDNPALGASRSHIYAAWDLQQVREPQRDPGEFVSLHWRSLDWVKQAVREDIIQDRVLVSAVAYLLLHEWI